MEQFAKILSKVAKTLYNCNSIRKTVKMKQNYTELVEKQNFGKGQKNN